MTIKTPDWVKNAVFYQIFPDRFAKSPRTKHSRGLTFKEWGSPPEAQGYQGGDLHGIVDKLDYLQDLGINAIYLNPIFSSASNHRYHTFDYFQVDPLLGGNDALRELVTEAHKRDVKIVLDGVFNHASRGFWAFHHILENGGNSPYIDWFFIYDYPLRPYSSNVNNPLNYGAWWDLPALPKFNTDNPGVRDYIMQVARYWIEEYHIDGWRLDVPYEIDDDSFWQEFRQVVKGANPEAYIVGEVWHDAQRWLQGDQFDAVMNYIFGKHAISFFGADNLRPNYEHQNPDFKTLPIDAKTFAKNIEAMYALYDWEINYAQMNFYDSHDTARLLWMLNDNVTALKHCALFQMTMPGAPCIYYGDEIGMSGGDDPDCRGAFLWHDEDAWNRDLLDHYKQAIALRNQYPVLRTGDFKTLYAKDKAYAFQRQLDGQTAIVAFNTGISDTTLILDISDSSFKQIWGDNNQSEIKPENGQIALTIPANDALVLISNI